MLSIQGFVTIAQYVSNVPGVINPIGELSTFSKTYSKEKGEYTQTAVPGYTLWAFRSSNPQGETQTIPSAQVNEILEITRAIVAYATSHSRPYDVNDFVQTIQVQYQSAIRDLGFGPMVAGSLGQNLSLPSFVIWKSTANDDNEIRIWLSDEAFADQFTGYEITVIPPFDNLNAFFRPYSEVKLDLDALTITALAERMQEAKDRHPETVSVIQEYFFYNRYDQTMRTKTYWGILVYGKEGNYIDAIKDAIIDYLLTNSDYTEEQWRLIFPDIFKRTEMVVIPRWDEVATENLTEMSSLYSQVVNPFETLNFIKTLLPTHSDSFLQANTHTLPFPLKTVMSFVVNGSNNEIGKQNFKAMFPDYLPIPSTSTDFARMSIPTQQFALFVDDLLLEAERVTHISTLPAGMRRTYRDGRLFVAKVFDGVNYLVAAKFNEQYQ